MICKGCSIQLQIKSQEATKEGYLLIKYICPKCKKITCRIGFNVAPIVGDIVKTLN